MSDSTLTPEGSAVAQDQNQNTGPQLVGRSPLSDKLRSCSRDRKSLQDKVAAAVKEDFTEAIRVIEEILKYKPGAPAEKEQLFQAYRNRILNTGNRIIRGLPAMLDCFYVEELIQRQVTTVVMPREEGPWGLPKGVKHPSQRTT